MESVLVGGIVAAAGVWFVRWARGSAQGKRGCAGCGGCAGRDCAGRKS